MQMSTVGAGFMIGLLIMVLTLSPAVLEAGVEAGLGGTNCSDVKRQITRNWLQLESFFRDGDKGLKRPKSKDFFCVSPTSHAMPCRKALFPAT